MKRLVSVILTVMICMLSRSSWGEGFFPSLNEVFGISVPFIDNCVDASLVNKTQRDDGRAVEHYDQVSFNDYDIIGQCFSQSGFSLITKDLDGDVIHFMVKKDRGEVDFYYNIANQKLEVVYPKYYTEDRSVYSVEKGNTSLFPSLEELAGPILPRFSAALMREPDSSVRDETGKLTEEYRNFTDSDYNTVSTYLSETGCSVVNYSKTGKTLSINLEKDGSTFLMKYDPDKQSAIVEYAASDHIEPIATSTPVPTPTPVPTATPKPTVSPDEYNSYAALFVGIVKGTMKKPDSMEVHSIRVMEYQGDEYIVIDFSSMNGFGGYVREKYSFKFEKGHISLSGDSSDYDTYEKHSSQFSLIATLDVDTVLGLLKK